MSNLVTGIGPKRKRVTIERRSEALNAFGQQVDSWTALGTYFAEVTALSGRELATAVQVRAETSIRVAMRAPGVDVTAQDRLALGTRKLKILAVYDPEERGKELRIDCAEWPNETVA